MSKRASFYDSLVFSGYNLSLPSDEAERKQMARSLFGATMVACVDVLIEGAEKIIARHEEFSDFTAEQKEKVLSLVSHTAYGVLYWQCVKLDRFSGAGLEMYVVERNEEEEPFRSTLIVGPTEDELRWAYGEWVEEFGDHYDEDSASRYSPASLAEPPAVSEPSEES
jgi:hypothetical protein